MIMKWEIHDGVCDRSLLDISLLTRGARFGQMRRPKVRPRMSDVRLDLRDQLKVLAVARCKISDVGLSLQWGAPERPKSLH